MTMRTLDGPEVARGLRSLSEREAPVSETARTLSEPLVEALWETGLMTYLNAPEAGGVQPAFSEIIETWIEMASQDASFGWIGIANLPSAMAASVYLPDAGFEEVFGDDRRVTVAGQFFPNGTGDAKDDGYVLNGSWNFGSGSAHSEYIAAGFFPVIDGEPDFDLSHIRAALIPQRRGHLHRRMARAGPPRHWQLRLHGERRVRPGAPLLPPVRP